MNKAFNPSGLVSWSLTFSLLITVSFLVGERSYGGSFDQEILTACYLSPGLVHLSFIPAGVAQGRDEDLAKNNLYDSCLESMAKDLDYEFQSQAPELCEHLVQVEGMCFTGRRDQVLRRLKWQWAGVEGQEVAPLKSSASIIPQRGHPYDAFSCLPKSGVSCSEI